MAPAAGLGGPHDRDLPPRPGAGRGECGAVVRLLGRCPHPGPVPAIRPAPFGRRPGRGRRPRCAPRPLRDAERTPPGRHARSRRRRDGRGQRHPPGRGEPPPRRHHPAPGEHRSRPVSPATGRPSNVTSATSSSGVRRPPDMWSISATGYRRPPTPRS